MGHIANNMMPHDVSLKMGIWGMRGGSGPPVIKWFFAFVGNMKTKSSTEHIQAGF